ncbi:C2 domain [Plasmopara halstedii]|uniref:C2 domain n=1 Tax=Plasmopara halstedii TaxID=4781 RepID=A0A0P1ACI9_PLAHL|nr:C2 domain [Plasmopara halstedii]CEG38142.1 C2 domain [Plasmopara halstedii]|eukprot:XP_024574511.1 C2 domain [Plasmopara halstedii]
MTTDVTRSISLSRRYLSLPHELTGCSLPPMVSGKQLGNVTLCVAHILPSAVSSLLLPRVSLVRVRWWGEDTPGSLFRPNLLSGDSVGSVDIQDSPHRIITMKYPVTVLSEQLVEYFEDMGHLTLDVFDKDSRRKLGECLLPLDLAKGNNVITAEEKLVALRRNNVLCEIKARDGEESEIVGYLAVTFDVEWMDDHSHVDSDVNIVDKDEQADFELLTHQVKIRNLDETKEKVKTDLNMIENSEPQSDVLTKNKFKESESEINRVDSQRVQKLLEKGKALQKLMEKAITVDCNSDIKVKDLEHFITSQYAPDHGIQETHVELNDFMCPLNQWSDSAVDSGHSSSYQQLSLSADHSADADVRPMATMHPSNAELHDRVIALVITFDSLELNRDFVDNQLRKLRDSTSISSRYSPVQINVSHDKLSSLLIASHVAAKNHAEIGAFTVSTSLRKRYWQLGCSSTLPMTLPSSLTEADSGNNKNLRFYVRCKVQSDTHSNKKKRKQNRILKSPKQIILEGAVDASKLLAVAKQSDKTWATTIQLNLKSDSQYATKGYDIIRNRRNDRSGMQRLTKFHSAGNLKVAFAYHTDAATEQKSASEPKSDADSGMSLSSISSIQVDQAGAVLNDIIDPDSSFDKHQQHETQRSFQTEAVDNDGLYTNFSFQFAVMLENVSNVNNVALRECNVQLNNRRDLVVDDISDASISLRYTILKIFSNLSSHVIKFERTVTRNLKLSRWSNSASILKADFGRKTHIFESSFANDSIEYFLHGHLIFEAWVQFAKSSERKLLGLAKVPLRQLAVLLSKEKVDQLSVSKNCFPSIDIGGAFPIINPFTGLLSGYLRARVCIGTAEQLLTWVKIIPKLVKLQGMVRGVLSRKQIHCYTSSTTLRPDPITSRSVAIPDEINRSDSQSTAPTLTSDIISFGHSCWKEDASNNQSESSLNNEKACGGEFVTKSSLILRKIRFEVCQSWRSGMQNDKYKDEGCENGARTCTPLLGCELQGQIVLIGDSEYPGNVIDLPFALWWDAADKKLNSHFSHSFQVNGLLKKEVASLGSQSQVLFALHVENGFFGLQSRETITGEARLNLYEELIQCTTKGDRIGQHAEVENHVNVNIPIVWDRGESGHRALPSAIPLTISYQMSKSENMTALTELNTDNLENADAFCSTVGARHHVGADLSDVRDVRLIPASLVLSFHLLSIEDFERLLDENRHLLIANLSSSTGKSSDHFSDLLDTQYDARCVCFDTTICLGNSLHEMEKKYQQNDVANHDSRIRVYMENGKWFKRWRSPDITIPVTGDKRTKTFEDVFMRIHLLLNSDTVAILQQDCARVSVLLSCEICREPHELGCVSFPLAAVLYRPDGVRGMFSIRVLQVFSAARVGVHCFVDHTNPLLTTIGANQETISPPLMSPTSPDEIPCDNGDLLNVRSLRSCKVCIEEVRNLIVDDAGTTFCIYVAFEMTKQSLSEASISYMITTKKTDIKAGPDFKWNYWDVLDVDDDNWQSYLLKVSVWRYNNYELNEYNSDERFVFNKHETDVLIGSVSIDLSLFDRGWRDIDGWYHIKNAQYETRGQVKVHVQNLCVEETQEGSDPMDSTWSPGHLIESFGKDDAAEILPTFDGAIQAVYQASVEVKEHLACLHPSDHSSSQTIDVARVYTSENSLAECNEKDIPKFTGTTPYSEQDLVLEAKDASFDGDAIADHLIAETTDHSFTSQAMRDKCNWLNTGQCDNADDGKLLSSRQMDEATHVSLGQQTKLIPHLFESAIINEDEVIDHKRLADSGGKEDENSGNAKLQSSDSDLASVKCFDIDCLWQVPDVQVKKIDKIKVAVADIVSDNNWDVDVLCENEPAPSETDSILDDDTEGIQHLLSDVISSSSSHNSKRQYADKAVQVNPLELGFQIVEMKHSPLQSTPLEENGTIGNELDAESCFGENKETADVGCDPIEISNSSSLSISQLETKEIPQILTIKHDLEGEYDKILTSDNLNGDICVTSNVQSAKSDKSKKERETCEMINVVTPTSALQNEKLELMYEMLRDVREFFLVAKTASVVIQDRENQQYRTSLAGFGKSSSRNDDAERLECPGSPILDDSSRNSFGPNDIEPYHAHEHNTEVCGGCPDTPNVQVVNHCQLPDDNFSEMTDMEAIETIPHTCEKVSLKKQVEIQGEEIIKATVSDPRNLQTLHNRTVEDRSQWSTIVSPQRGLKPCDLPTRYSEHKSRQKDDRYQSSMHSLLFKHDSETERIARIMQGSMKYWMKDDESSSSDDQTEEFDGQDCFF